MINIKEFFKKDARHKRAIKKAIADTKKAENKKYFIGLDQIKSLHSTEISQKKTQYKNSMRALVKECDDKIDTLSRLHKESMVTMVSLKDATIDDLEKENEILTNKIHKVQDIYQEYLLKLEDSENLLENLENHVNTLLITSGRIRGLHDKLTQDIKEEKKVEEKIRNSIR